MHDDKNNNGSNSDAPQPNEHNRYSRLTEAEFLAHEAELAKTAMANVLAELKSNLAKAADIKLWAHHYPWLTVGAAAATGFTLATIATGKAPPNPETDGEEASRQRMVRDAASAPYNSLGAKPKLGDSLLGSLFSLARTALEASLVAAIRTEGAERTQAADSNAASRDVPPEAAMRFTDRQ